MNTERYDTMQMLEVAAGIISDNAHLLYGGNYPHQYDKFVSQMRERAKELVHPLPPERFSQPG